jgi:hypothetical protein
MNKIKYKTLSLLCFGILFLFQACKKDKIDFSSDDRSLTENRVNSTVRIINIGGFNQVIANGDSLTNFQIINPTTGQQFRITSYFPSEGKLGKSWYVPQNLFDQQGIAKLDIMTRTYQTEENDIELDLKNDYANPTDYFLMPTLHMDGQPAVVPIKRGVTAPSKPDHFKIRIVNLSGTIKNPGNNGSGSLEDLTGSVSLAYADGTLVNTQTNGISSNQKTSEYIELPYGTYQFKLLMEDGRQMPALGSESSEFTILDPPTSTVPRRLMESTNLTYAPIQTYQPGGIYTILIAPQSFKYIVNDLDETANTYQNSFQILNDNSAPVNNTYFRIQGVNSLNTQNVSFKVNGKTISTDAAFGKAGVYANFIQGSHTVEAIDASGKVIATTVGVFRPSQNYSAWLYSDKNGSPKLDIIANDLSGATYTGTELDDATYARNQYRFFFFKRFLNFSPDNPYITFTSSNGQPVAGVNDSKQVGVNMQPGVPLFEKPFAAQVYTQAPFEIMAYRSNPNVVPGAWANDITVLTNADFIANKKLYENVARKIPVQEAGIYTVALIGKTSDTNPDTKAKMIIIKHNK